MLLKTSTSMSVNRSIYLIKKGTVFVMNTQHSKTDVILIGGGIMSATLGTLLKELTPEKISNYSKD